MSNRDWAGPYWQDQDGDYGPGRRAGSGNGSGSGSGRNGYSRAAGSGTGQTWTGIVSGRARGSHHAQRGPRGGERSDWTGRLGQTAGGMRGRLGRGGGQRGYGAPQAPTRTGRQYWRDADLTDRLTGSRPALDGSRRSYAPGGRGSHGRRAGGGGGWDGGRRRRGSWWRRWTVKKVLGLLGAAAAVVILVLIGAFFLGYSRTQIPTAETESASWQSSIVYYANGQQMGHFDKEGVERLQLTAAQIPPVMTQAMTAAEDRHFYTEGGVSMTGIVRAGLSDVFGSGNLQGASTITMQYAKNALAGVNGGQNATTKAKEIFIAMKLGRTKSKQWVMTNYLNLVPFGGPEDTGLGSAAMNYFGVNLSNGGTLTLEQAAMLAALPNSPGFLNPDPKAGAGYTALVARYQSVLSNMVKDGNITAQQEAGAAAHFPKLTKSTVGGNGETGDTAYLMDMVQQQLTASRAYGGYGLSLRQLETGGYKIKTTFRPVPMRQLKQSVNAEEQAMKAAGAPFRRYDRIGAVLEDPKTGAIRAIYGGPGVGTAHCRATSCSLNTAEDAEPVGSSFKPYVLADAVNQGMNVFTSQLAGFSPLYVPIQLWNDPSDFAQLEKTPSLTSAPAGFPRDTKVGLSGKAGDTEYFYMADGEDEAYNRPLAVNFATAVSSDAAYVDLVHRDGIQNVINMAKAFGVGQNPFVQPCKVKGSNSASVATVIADCNDMTGPTIAEKDADGQTVPAPDNGMQTAFGTSEGGAKAANTSVAGSPALALGENPLTAVEQASTFATLADDGVYHTPHVIASLQRGGRTLKSPVVTRQVLSKAAAADVDYALSFDNNMPGGTAEANVPFRRGGVIGKTGTPGTIQAAASQAWFVGATPAQAAMSVALFTNESASQSLGNMASLNGSPGSNGGAWPAAIWNQFMTTAYGNTPAAPMFPTSQLGFQTWIQAKPKTPTCSPQQMFGNFFGQHQNCTCPRHAPFCTKGKNGNNNGNNGKNGNPVTGPTTGPVTGPGTDPGTGPSPNPVPTVGPGTSPAPIPGPSTGPQPSPTPSPTSPPANCGPQCDQSPAADAAALVTGAAPGGSSPPVNLTVLLAEDPAASRAPLA